MAETPEVLERMLAMWNERDLSKVRPHIEEVFDENVVFIDPANSITGHDAFEEMVREFRTRWPDAELSRSSGSDGHHDLYRYHWEIRQHTELLMTGFDVAEVASNGRVSKVLGFFGPVPSN